MADDNIVVLPVISIIDLPADRIIEAATGKLDQVVIIGYDTDGEEYFASSIADGSKVVWLMERAKFKLMSIVGSQE